MIVSSPLYKTSRCYMRVARRQEGKQAGRGGSVRGGVVVMILVFCLGRCGGCCAVLYGAV